MDVISCPVKGCKERIVYRFGVATCPKHGVIRSGPKEAR